METRQVSAEYKGNDLSFIMSTDTLDRYGDTVNPDGWDLDNFHKNPIALFNHNHNQVIGKWANVRVEGGALKGELKLAEVGTSELVDTLHKLVEQDILKAVSVGFKPIEHTYDDETYGVNFYKQELLECSLVSVPANPDAVNISKSMKDLIFKPDLSSYKRRAMAARV